MTLGLSAVLLLHNYDQDWLPHDEGTLAHAAERVLDGELPHRDFDDLYTGGVSLLHAAVMATFGESLHSLRLALLLIAAAAVPVIYLLARRAASPVFAGFATILCVAWSFPNYGTPMPSWYVLFFALLVAYALCRLAETERRRWVFAAGIFAGLAFLSKQTGVYQIAATMLFLLYRDQRRRTEGAPSAGGAWAVSALYAVGLVLFVVLVAVLIARVPSVMNVLHFALPGIAFAVVLLAAELRLARAERSGTRLLGELAIFALGLLVPVGAFVAPYAASGSLAELFHGVFVLPRGRLELPWASRPLPPPASLLLFLPTAWLLFGPRLLWGGALLDRALAAALVLAGAAALILGDEATVHAIVWWTARPVVPLVTLVGLVYLRRDERRTDETGILQQQTFAVLGAGAFLSMVQFPFAAEIYFCFAAPPVVLMLLFVSRLRGHERAWSMTAAGLLYLAFAVGFLHPRSICDPDEHLNRARNTAWDAERAGIAIPQRFQRIYDALAAEVGKHAGPDDPIFAMPDCPEVYFLTGTRSVTRSILDVFDQDYATPELRNARILDALEREDVSVVVLKRVVPFTPLVSEELTQALLARYPERVDLRLFTVLSR